MSSGLFAVIGPNLVGRDFVVGDIHGAFDLVLQGMRAVAFNRAQDRIFSLGDLIDRGAGSVRVLEFLAKPYVYSVMGNHDAAFASMSLELIRSLGKENWNGMGWVCTVPDTKLHAIKARLVRLPIAMQVQTSRGIVGLVHGDVPAGMDWPAFTAAVQGGDVTTINTALKGRRRVASNDDGGVSGIDRIFVGHSIQWDGPKRLGNVFAIDTGAVFREISGFKGALTFANLQCATEALVHCAGPEVSHAVRTHALPGSGAFSAHPPFV